MKLRPIGDVYVPKELEYLFMDNPPIKLFGSKELNQFDKIFSHLRKGGLVVVSGAWDKILDVFGYLDKKKGEFSKIGARRSLFKDENQRTRPWYGRHYQEILERVMVIAKDDYVLDIDLNEKIIHIPYFLELLGDPAGSNEGFFLVPVTHIQKIQANMKQRFYISALNLEIIAHSNVLSPISQDTIALFQEALEKIGEKLPESIEILDMGCGCGVLSLLAAKVFSSRAVNITATDILPEAIATTKLNVERHLKNLAGDSVKIQTTNSGNLFEPIGDSRFDLIIFNVPWVTSRPRSRAEIATYDENQNTVRKFLLESPKHLNNNGHIALGYSDHSGIEALEKLEGFIKDSGLIVNNIYKNRIQSRQGKRKWETIIVHDLVGYLGT